MRVIWLLRPNSPLNFAAWGRRLPRLLSCSQYTSQSPLHLSEIYILVGRVDNNYKKW